MSEFSKNSKVLGLLFFFFLSLPYIFSGKLIHDYNFNNYQIQVNIYLYLQLRSLLGTLVLNIQVNYWCCYLEFLEPTPSQQPQNWTLDISSSTVYQNSALSQDSLIFLIGSTVLSVIQQALESLLKWLPSFSFLPHTQPTANPKDFASYIMLKFIYFSPATLPYLDISQSSLLHRMVFAH